MHTKVSLIMQVTTDPSDRTAATSHSGGWSESAWLPGQIASSAQVIRSWALIRANLLPKQATIVGFRLAYYNLVGNKQLSQGTSSGKFNFPGIANRETDLPQVALEMAGSTAGGANSNRFTLRCIPDEMMLRGEYQPTPAFKTAVTNYATFLTIGNAFGFVGRDLSLASQRVLKIDLGVITLDAALPGVAVNTFIRLNRVFDVQGNPIKGSFRVTAVAGAAYTVVGLDGRQAGTSGTAREDAISFFDYAVIKASRAVVKKVGRPFEGYRGRASKRVA